jgi:hypothetical protein
MFMAQVSDSTAGVQEAVRSLQSQNAQQSNQATQESNSQSPSRSAEDKVVISPEANSETNNRIKEDARNNKNAEVQLRKFQNQNTSEVRIDPRKVSESVEEVQQQREQSAKARETVFEAPSQRIIEEGGSSETSQARSAENNVRSNEGTESNRPAQSPSSVQTETGQNVDDVI